MNFLEACKLMLENNGGYIRHPALRDVGQEREYMHCNWYVTDEWEIDFWLDINLDAYIYAEEEENESGTYPEKFYKHDLSDDLTAFLTARDFIRDDWIYKPVPKGVI